ncbi:RDD family protein [Salinisphaera sp. T31B1]|uniref:RDD family protein n=1 Tax=Salinisphaera sp. T31B1 TaxID=727963 RepID=UPI003342D73E
MAGDRPVASQRLVYAGFWIRVWASIIDTVLVMVVLYPLASLLPGAYTTMNGSVALADRYGRIDYQLLAASMPGPMHVLLFWVLPAVAVVLFWIARSATPGKMAIGARIVDASTGAKPGAGRMVIRYLGYFVSTFPLGLGLIWVGIDRRKQGWHDKLAGTVVVRDRARVEAHAHFEGDPTSTPRGSTHNGPST